MTQTPSAGTTDPPVAELVDQINRLREENHAVVLAHNYQIPEIQDIAEVTGDSLVLSI